MSNRIKPGDYILITRHRHPETGLADNLEGLCAHVVKAYADGCVTADMLFYNRHLGIERHVKLHPREYEPATLKNYGVTVCRTGYVPGIPAVNENQAKKIVDLFITHDDVSWSDDWPASDAEVNG
jgi:hypothetical protein